jgi:hypothetical protein
VLEKLAVLELVLDEVAVIGARLLQKLLELVGVAQSLARAVGSHNRVGVGMTPTFFFLFPNPEEGPSSWSSLLALPLARPLVKTT